MKSVKNEIRTQPHNQVSHDIVKDAAGRPSIGLVETRELFQKGTWVRIDKQVQYQILNQIWYWMRGKVDEISQRRD